MHIPASPGTVVGNDYVLSHQIGQGSFAVVWKAQHRVTGEAVAIKEINTARLSRKLKQSLEGEISILRRITHINIVKLHHVVEDGDRMFLIMEYCAGGDLSGFIRTRKRVPEATARGLLVQLAAGLRELWSHHLVHRDLKPQNLLLSEEGAGAVLKIADFGFARALQPHNLAETLCGSPLYMAPEILQFHKYDSKADLWSVGSILYELLVGRPPFTGANHVQLLRAIERSDARIPPALDATLTPACRALIAALLKRNPVERISFEELFSHPFLSPSTHQDHTAAPPPADTPQPPATAFACTVLEHGPTPALPPLAIAPPPAHALQPTTAAAHPLGDAVAVAQGGGARPPPGPPLAGPPLRKAGHASVDEEDYVMVDSCPFASVNRADSRADVDKGAARSDDPAARCALTASTCAERAHAQPEGAAPVSDIAAVRAPPPEPDPFADDDLLAGEGLPALSEPCVFPLQPLEQDVMWEVARTLDYLACCRHENGHLEEALPMQLLALELLLALLGTNEPPSAPRSPTSTATPPTTTPADAPTAHVDDVALVKQAAIKLATTAHATAGALAAQGWEGPLPDVVGVVHRCALHMGRGGAVEELLGNRSGAAHAYAKAGTLLYFLCTDLALFPAADTFQLQERQRAALHRLVLYTSARLTACRRAMDEGEPAAAA